MKMLPLNATVRKYKCKLRLNNKNAQQTAWASWIIAPDGLHIETSCTEPVNANKVETVEVDVFATPRSGRMASISDSDFLKNVKAELDKSKIEYAMKGNNIVIALETLL